MEVPDQVSAANLRTRLSLPRHAEAGGLPREIPSPPTEPQLLTAAGSAARTAASRGYAATLNCRSMTAVSRSGPSGQARQVDRALDIFPAADQRVLAAEIRAYFSPADQPAATSPSAAAGAGVSADGMRGWSGEARTVHERSFQHSAAHAAVDNLARLIIRTRSSAGRPRYKAGRGDGAPSEGEGLHWKGPGAGRAAPDRRDNMQLPSGCQQTRSRRSSSSYSGCGRKLSASTSMPVLGRADYFLRTGRLPPPLEVGDRPRAAAPAKGAADRGSLLHASRSRSYGAMGAVGGNEGGGSVLSRRLTPDVAWFASKREAAMKPLVEMEQDRERLERRAAAAAAAVIPRCERELAVAALQWPQLQPTERKSTQWASELSDTGAHLQRHVETLQRQATEREKLLLGQEIDRYLAPAAEAARRATSAAKTAAGTGGVKKTASDTARPDATAGVGRSNNGVHSECHGTTDLALLMLFGERAEELHSVEPSAARQRSAMTGFHAWLR